MKNFLTVFVLICLMCLTGCSETDNNPTEGTEKIGGIDVDLTVMSDTLISAEVYNILTNQSDYIGKTIKAKGSYAVYDAGNSRQYYHYIKIVEGDQCCEMGMEFSLDGNHAYPDDYPEAEAKIEVTGVYESYEESGSIYYCLVVDDIVIL